jgi:hypothetical protein
MGQSSVIASSMHFLPMSHVAQGIPDLLLNAMVRSGLYIFGLLHSMIFSEKTFVQVPDPVKRKIVSCLNEYKADHPLTNGQRALTRHGILEKFSWALENQSQTSIMLVWHIATEYCSISLPSEEEKGGASMFVWPQGSCGLFKNKKESSGNQQVATTLSRYCAYLMSFVPALLPGNSTDTLFILEDMLSKADAEKLLQYKREPRTEISLEPSQDSKRSSNEDTSTMIHDSRGYDDDIITARESRGDSSTNNNSKDDDICWDRDIPTELVCRGGARCCSAPLPGGEGPA